MTLGERTGRSGDWRHRLATAALLRRGGWAARATLALQRSDWTLLAAISISALGYIGWFLVLHLRSVGWAPGQILDGFGAYWEWFYRTLMTQDEVFAVRRSRLASRHPLYEIGAWLVTVLGYLLLIFHLRRKSSLSLRHLIGLAVLFSVPLLLLPNLLSSDIYSYISFGRVAALHGANPFIDPPAAFPADPMMRWVHWTTVPSVYGPAWIYPSMLLTWLIEATLPNIVSYVLAYKLLALGLHLVNGRLIWLILQWWQPEANPGTEPEAGAQRIWGTALYLLNPLALIEFAGNAHNDVLMITFVLLAVLAHLSRRTGGALALLTLAVLVKWVALPLVGLYALLLLWQAERWRDRLREGLRALLIVAGICVALYAPYWEAQGAWDKPASRHTLRILFDAPPQKRFINSLGDLFVREYGRLMWRLGHWPNPALLDPLPFTSVGANATGDNSEPDSWQAREQMRYRRYIREQQRARNQLLQLQGSVQDVVRKLGLVIFAAASLVSVLRARNLWNVLFCGAWILFAYATVTAVWVWPWYATWFVALAALLDWRVTGRTAVMVSVLALLLYPLYPLMPEPTLLERYRALLVWGVPLGWALWQGMRSHEWSVVGGQ